MVFFFGNDASKFRIDDFIMYPVTGYVIRLFLQIFRLEVTEILWDFSIWVESCTILPQLIMIQANTEVRQPACAAAVNCHALPASTE